VTDTEHLQRVREIFNAVIDLPAGERGAVLAQLTGDNAALRREVEEVISGAESTASILESPVIGNSPVNAASIVGARLGPYTVVRLIGMGGMGAVYEAVRDDDQFQKRVAIKIVQRDIDSETTLARFRRERQILASLQHPNIATLHDGGVMPDGRPFLVMEYVDGAPITTWCNARSLPLRDRVALFRQVCSAVHYAHKNLIIHRDIKPGNILVTDDGTVKLLDFGIAKLLTADDATDGGNQPLTRGGARAFTPEYASPEQIRGDTLTTASDLYSLGVVLFELLTSRRPHLTKGKALVDIERAVLDTPVPRPSSVVTDDAAHHVGERSRDRLRQRLHGDLDSIALTALQLEAARRYSSVEAFGDDLRRYLEGLPVQAQRDWAGYRFTKFVQRNKVAAVISLLLLLALVGGVITTTLQARRARAEQLQALQVSAFLRGLLASVQPEIGRRDAQVSQVLDSASKRIDRELAASPDVRSELESVIAESYQGLGRYDDAEPHFKKSLQLREQTAGMRSPAALTGLRELAELYLAKGTLDSAETTLHDALAREPAGSGTPDTIRAALLSDLGSLAHGQGHDADAERWHRAALAIQQRVYGPTSDQVAMSLDDISIAVGDQGNLPQAEVITRQALALLRTNHPEPNERVAVALAALATELDFQGKPVPAESAYVETLALRKRVLGPEHPDYTTTLFNYSMFIFDQKRYKEAAEYSREILALRGKTLPESHQSISAALQTLGRCLDQLGDTQGGEKALLESLELRRKYMGPETWQVASSEGVLGEHYTFVKDYPRAEQTLLQAQQQFVRTLGETSPRTQVNTRRLVALYAAWGKPAIAAEYSAKLAPSK
jgi:serine/threonine protein kinase/tetratricopeptide (TPR) repeat protein